MSTAVPDAAARHISTLADLPFHVAKRFPDRVVLRQCRGDDRIDTSGHQLFEQVRDLNLGLRDLGLTTGDRVALIAESRPEWCVTDLAMLSAGAVSVPLYPTVTAGQVQEILSHS